MTPLEQAVADVLAGSSNNAAAKRRNVPLSTLRAALRRQGVPPRSHPSGPDHHAYVDGRTAARRQRTPCAAE